jgi:uncharacterized membrane protein
MTGPSPRWRALVFASLAFNLLFAGVTAGALAAGARIETSAEAAQPAFAAPRAFIAAMPDDLRGVLRARMIATWRDARPERRQSRAARQAALAALEAEPFDPVELRDALATMRAADQAVLARFQGEVVDVLASLTPQQRRDLAKALTERTRWADGAAPAAP